MNMLYIKFMFIIPLLFITLNSNAQKIKVIDTDFSKGQLINIQTIKYSDLVKFHGHSCDGLLEGMQALMIGLAELYPDGIIDRTNTRVISKSSPCLTDAAIYITGGRYQYNSFFVSNNFDGLYIIQRIDNKKAVRIERKHGLKPTEIDSLGNLAIDNKLSYTELQKLKKMEKNYANFLSKKSPKSNFTVEHMEEFKWLPVLNNNYIKTDIINKHNFK